MTEATSNAKQVYYLLVEFDQDYGCFPGDTTAVGVMAECRGDYANDYFAQLFRGGYTTSEEIFYAKGGSKKSKKADNDIKGRGRLLEAGENGFAYIKGLHTGSDGRTPVVLTPMRGEGVRFDPDPHNNKAVVLRVDGSVKQLRIDRDTGQAEIGEGKTLFQSGEGTAWAENEFNPNDLLFAK